MKPVASGSDRTPDGLRNDDALTLMAASNVEAPYAPRKTPTASNQPYLRISPQKRPISS